GTAQARRDCASGSGRWSARVAACHGGSARRKRALSAGAGRYPSRTMTGAPAAAASTQPLLPVLAIVWVGLIGGSFAAALRASGTVGRVLGVGRQAASLASARALGIIDEVATLEQAAQEADLVFLAAPVGATASILAAMKPYLRAQTLITD